MLTNRKKYKIVKNKIKQDPFEIDEEGREIVDITVADTDELLSVYRPDGKKVISSEMANVISDSTKATTFGKDIHLRIACEKHTESKELIYRNAITNYYVNEFAEKERKLKNNIFVIILVFCLAILSFGLLYLVNIFNLPWIIVEFIDIVAWVFSWETVDLFFFQRRSIKYEQRRDLQIIFATITFLDINKQ